MPLPSPPTLADPVRRWPALAAGAAAVAAIGGLWAVGELAAGPAALAAALIATAALGAALAAAPRPERGPRERVASFPPPGAAPPFASLVDALPDPILVVSAEEPDDLTGRRYRFANSAARELLRLDRGEGLLVSAVRDPAVLEAVDEALFGAAVAECLYETQGARARILKVQARPLGVAADGARLAVLVFRDETELRQVEQTRADFLANASHELRTPLASLSGFIETLRGHARQDEGARERFLGIMQAQAERMSRLIDDLMSLSRIELNEHIAPADAVDLAMAVTDVVDAAQPIARERGVRLETVLPPKGQAVICGDRDQIIQVAQNLVDNAIKYSPDGGAVEVRVEASLTALQAAAGGRPEAARLSLLTPDHAGETYAALRVSDQGRGMDREHLPRLTERFYRVEGQKSGERSGTGLGLAIVKHIANRHRGGLVVESAPGEGTTFTAYFPLKTAAAQAPVAKAS